MPIAVHSSITCQLLHKYKNIEMISVTLNLRPKLTLVCVYAPPNASNDYHNHILEAITQLPCKTDVIILGDFKVPDINWGTLTAHSQFSQDLCSELQLLNFNQ